jgi:3-hydroxyacyl-CoA dehydrogenase
MNPVPVMPVVESSGADVRGEPRRAAFASAGQKGQAKDAPGFIVNRLLVPYLLTPRIFGGSATREDIDASRSATTIRWGC